MKNQDPGILVLSDGTIFEGVSIGQKGHVCGEVVFNTAQTGYQEVLTDPSYTEQLIVFTQPHIGNVGINSEDMESDRIFANGIIMHSVSEVASNWRSEETLQNFLKKQQLIAISEIDTRALTHHLRHFGSQSGCIMTGDIDYNQALNYAKSFSGLLGKDLVQEVTTKKSYTFGQHKTDSHHIVVYDYGVKRSILKCLSSLDCSVTIVPATTKAEDVLALKPDGIVLSNGPGDPSACTYAIETIKSLLKNEIPIMAICLGHQLLALASGAQTKKMAFGHHGANHPIQHIKNSTVSISNQNHGFVVSEENLPKCLSVTHRSLFDSTIAGIERLDVPAFGFQGHPEAGPGPVELTLLFKQFKFMIEVNYAQKN
jgi:carbamoyl-phosphate synthase small subunit